MRSSSTNCWGCTRAPRLRKIVVFDMEGLHDLADPQVLSLDARALGRVRRGAPGEWERRVGLRDRTAIWSIPPAPPASPKAR
jgi:hypothetical protein